MNKMNDRYLYRAKRIDNGEWITGYLLVKKKDFYICEKPYECMDEYSSLNGQSYGFGGFKFVDPSTICQCTGLKDKNGKLIWENDIVKHDFGKDQIGVQLAIVKYDSKYACYQIKPIYDWMYCDKSECEVISNIFDNQELLEK